MVAATNPFSPSITPASYEVLAIGAIKMPPIAPSAADRPKLSVRTRRVSTPTSCAARRLCAVARMPLPRRVRSKKSASPATTTRLVAATHRLCGSIVAPASTIGLSPENGASAWAPLPIVASTPPRRTIETPMVMMMRVVTSAPRAGSIAILATMQADRDDRGRRRRRPPAAGARQPATRNAAIMPPSMMNSPCAKLITPEAL